MDSELSLLIAIVLSIPIVALVSLVLTLLQRGRVRRLEAAVAGLTARLEALDRGPADARMPSAREAEPAADPEPVATPAEATPAPQPARWGSASTVREEDPAWGEMPTAPVTIAADSQDFEARLGSRWAVIVGGLALALGGIFLVRYTIEQGLLGPMARVMLGAAFATVLLAVGEVLRRRDPGQMVPGFGLISIPAVVTAAGTSSAFATAYAAHALYDFIGPAIAFALLGAIALATMVLSAVHGPALAALGLIGGYVSPLLVSSDDPAPEALFLYLGFVTFAAFGLARLRHWRWLAITASVFAIAWGVLTVLLGLMVFEPLVMGLYTLVLLGLAAGFLIVDVYRDGFDESGWPDIFANAVVTGIALLALLVMIVGEHEGFVAIVGVASVAGMIALATCYRAVGPLAVVALITALLTMISFDVPIDASDPVGALAPAGPLGVGAVVPERVTAFWILAAAFGVALIAGFAVFGGRSPSRDYLALAAGLGGTGLVAAAYWRVVEFESTPVFVALALGVAGLNAVLTELAIRRSQGSGADNRAIAFAATGTVAALCLGLTILLDKGWLTVSLALLTAAIGWLASWRTIAGLGPLAIAVALIIVGRLIYDPMVVGGDLGTAPILNWLLWGYGVPTIAFAYVSISFRRQGATLVANVFEVLAAVFLVALIIAQIHHLVHAGDMLQEPVIGEVGAIVTALILLALVSRRRRAIGDGGMGELLEIGFLVLGALGAILLMLGNPGFTDEPVGQHAFFNGLIPGYLLPALALTFYVLEAWRERPRVAAASGILALVMGFFWITLTTRHIFQPFDDGILDRPIEGAELYAYSAVWLGYGIALLAAGLITRTRLLRLASAILIVLAVVKAFLVDMAELEGVLRALSFIGLGVVLIGIGLVYQKLLGSRPQQPPAAPEPTPAPSDTNPKSGAPNDTKPVTPAPAGPKPPAF